MMSVLGQKFVGYVSFDTVADANRAAAILGDLGGGSAHIDQQLFLRPAFPWFRYRMPVRGLYLASASTHPGAGVHGACGLNAAREALRDQ
jgi:phytoene dehydrogenase-like protein